MNDGERGAPRVPQAHPTDDGDPLPRRSGRTHLEPRLRDPGGTRSGTPFAAFDPDAGPARTPASDPPPPDATGSGTADGAPAGSRAAAFRAAVRRAAGRPPRDDG